MTSFICSTFLSVFCVSGHYPLDSLENTDLFLAIAQGDFVTAENILQNGVVLDEDRSVHKATAFHALAITDDEQGSIEFFSTLLQYGGDINDPDFYGITGFMHAVRKKRYQLAQKYLQNDQFDIFRKTNKDENIFHIFAKTDLTNPDARQALDMALSQEDIASIINGGSLFGQYPIHYAIYERNTELIQALVDQLEMNINVTNVFGDTPLLLALKIISKIFNKERVNSSDLQKISEASQIIQIMMSSPHDTDLAIKNKRGQSSYDELLALKEYLSQLPEDSPIHLATEPMRDILYLEQSLVYHQ